MAPEEGFHISLERPGEVRVTRRARKQAEREMDREVLPPGQRRLLKQVAVEGAVAGQGDRALKRHPRGRQRRRHAGLQFAGFGRTTEVQGRAPYILQLGMYAFLDRRRDGNRPWRPGRHDEAFGYQCGARAAAVRNLLLELLVPKSRDDAGRQGDAPFAQGTFDESPDFFMCEVGGASRFVR